MKHNELCELHAFYYVYFSLLDLLLLSWIFYAIFAALKLCSHIVIIVSFPLCVEMGFSHQRHEKRKSFFAFLQLWKSFQCSEFIMIWLFHLFVCRHFVPSRSRSKTTEGLKIIETFFSIQNQILIRYYFGNHVRGLLDII